MGHINPSIEIQRLEQVSALSTTELDGSPVLVVGSLGHAAVTGTELPTAVKKDGSLRDIDVYVPSPSDNFVLESILQGLSLDRPAPLDAGANNLLRREANGIYATRGEVAVELKCAEVFDTVTDYPLRGYEDMDLRSFAPLGMLALHNLEPTRRVFLHKAADERFTSWFDAHDLELPQELSQSIAEFRRAYCDKYPHASLLRHLSKAYVHLLPEPARRLTRPLTHSFMKRHAGRRTPTTEQLTRNTERPKPE